MESLRTVTVLGLAFIALACRVEGKPGAATQQEDDEELYKLPEGFLFGLGTSSYQAEGAWNEDGKGVNVFDYTTHENNLGNADVAADHYHRYKEDIALLHQMKVHLMLSSWSSRGGWKENAHVIKTKKACSSVKAYFPNLWRNAMNATFGTVHVDCPLPPGSYSARNFTIDATASTVVAPVFFYGKWRGDVKLIETETNVCGACVRAFAQIVPK